MCPEWLGDTAPEQFWQRWLSVGYFAKCATPPTPKRNDRGVRTNVRKILAPQIAQKCQTPMLDSEHQEQTKDRK